VRRKYHDANFSYAPQGMLKLDMSHLTWGTQATELTSAYKNSVQRHFGPLSTVYNIKAHLVQFTYY